MLSTDRLKMLRDRYGDGSTGNQPSIYNLDVSSKAIRGRQEPPIQGPVLSEPPADEPPDGPSERCPFAGERGASATRTRDEPLTPIQQSAGMQLQALWSRLLADELPLSAPVDWPSLGALRAELRSGSYGELHRNRADTKPSHKQLCAVGMSCIAEIQWDACWADKVSSSQLGPCVIGNHPIPSDPYLPIPSHLAPSDPARTHPIRYELSRADPV